MCTFKTIPQSFVIMRMALITYLLTFTCQQFDEVKQTERGKSYKYEENQLQHVLVECLDPLLLLPEYPVFICWSQVQNVSYTKVTTFVLQNPAESAFMMHVKQPA